MFQQFRIGQRMAGRRSGDQVSPDLGRVRNAHSGGCSATGVSSKTSILAPDWVKGITNRHLNGAKRSKMPDMSRRGSSPYARAFSSSPSDRVNGILING